MKIYGPGDVITKAMAATCDPLGPMIYEYIKEGLYLHGRVFYSEAIM